ncbi:MAG: 5-formyltetrahydrofolate cyclo-ligase [Oscillospiraceae bacterium]|nr:5-formyltetrahydrofolate cyclo-ligase [Oscillospiraceae bacterium]
MEKKELRKIFRAKRAKIHNKEEKDRIIQEYVLNMPEIKKADTVLVYVSYNSETSTRLIMESILNNNKNLAVPRCLENGIMEFIYINSTDELRSGAYGIPEPSGDRKAIISSDTVCIVPALSFSLDGTRLGYGGGYYDRFLSENNNIYKIGICYDELISEKLPSEKYDIKVQTVITEERKVLCSAER